MALLGKMTDVALSKRFGVSTSVLYRRRKELGIKPFRGLVEWTSKRIKLLVLAYSLGPLGVACLGAAHPAAVR